MTLYSTSPLQPVASGPREDLQIPFRVFVKIVPTLGKGRRWEMIRDVEKIQHLAELFLDDVSELNIEGPILYTHQIGQAPARLTITGWFITTGENVPPVDRDAQPGEIHSGTVPGEKTSLIERIPRGGSLSYGQDPTDITDTRVSTLKTLIEDALDEIPGFDKIIYIDFNGVEYGQIPNRKGFRSFPS